MNFESIGLTNNNEKNKETEPQSLLKSAKEKLLSLTEGINPYFQEKIKVGGRNLVLALFTVGAMSSEEVHAQDIDPVESFKEYLANLSDESISTPDSSLSKPISLSELEKQCAKEKLTNRDSLFNSLNQSEYQFPGNFEGEEIAVLDYETANDKYLKERVEFLNIEEESIQEGLVLENLGVKHVSKLLDFTEEEYREGAEANDSSYFSYSITCIQSSEDNVSPLQQSEKGIEESSKIITDKRYYENKKEALFHALQGLYELGERQIFSVNELLDITTTHNEESTNYEYSMNMCRVQGISYYDSIEVVSIDESSEGYRVAIKVNLGEFQE